MKYIISLLFILIVCLDVLARNMPFKSFNTNHLYKVNELNSLISSVIKNYYEICKNKQPNELICIDLTGIPNNIRASIDYNVNTIKILRNGNDTRLMFRTQLHLSTISRKLRKQLNKDGLIAILPKIELDKSIIRISLYLEKLRIVKGDLTVSLKDSVSSYYYINDNYFKPIESVNNFKDTLGWLLVEALNDYYFESNEDLDFYKELGLIEDDEFYNSKHYLIDKSSLPEKFPYDSLVYKDRTFIFLKASQFPPSLRKKSMNGLVVVENNIWLEQDGTLVIEICPMISYTAGRPKVICLTECLSPGVYYFNFHFSKSLNRWLIY